MKLPITVAVCTYNEEANIEGCLESVLANDPAQVIVVDNFSGDETWHIVKDWPGVMSVAVYVGGLASQRQVALDYTSQPYHMIVDAHHRLGPFCLRDLLDELREGGYHAIQAREWVPLAGEGMGWWTRARAAANFDITYARYAMPTRMVGRPALYETAALRKIGGFDPLFDGVGDEDTDVSIRMELHGFRQAQGTGLARRVDTLDFHSAMRKFVKYGRGDARICEKYPEKRWAIIRHQLWVYPWVRGLRRWRFWPYFALCGWVRFGAMVREVVNG